MKRCEHYFHCAYLQQFKSDARVLIFTHAYLPLPRNSHEKTRPDLVVIDESFFSTCIETIGIPRSRLEKLARKDVALQCVVSKLLTAIDDDEPVLAALRSAGITSQALTELHAEFVASGASFLDFPTDAEAEDWLTWARKKGVERPRVDLLLQILATELATSRTESHGVSYDEKRDAIRLHYRKPIARFQYPDGRPIIVIIDANANPDLLRGWFSDIAFEEFPAGRNAYVVQCSTSRGSTVSFAPWDKSHAESKARAKKNVAGLNELIRHEAQLGAKKVLVVGPQKICGNPKNAMPALVQCPPNGALEHFNGLRGVDIYKDFDTAIIIGRNQPAIKGVEDEARALWYDSPDPLLFADDWSVELRPYRLRDPSKSLGVDVLVHPDPRIQKLHEQIREGESTQVIDRLRLVHAKEPKRVIVVSNIPLDLEVDELVDLQTLLFRTRLDRAWDRLNGAMPLNPEWLSKTFPDLWPTTGAARTDLRGGG